MDIATQRTAYSTAALQGILAGEDPDIEYTAKYIAERVKEIVDYMIALDLGVEPTPESELYYGVPSMAPDLRVSRYRPDSAEVAAACQEVRDLFTDLSGPDPDDATLTDE